MCPHERKSQIVVAIMQAICAGVLGILLILVLVEANLNMGVKHCGEKTCGSMQYCDVHGICEDCRKICDQNNNNYQMDTCENQCQDYIHEQKFVTRAETSRDDDINSKVARLTALVTVTLVMVVFVLLILLALFFLLYRYRRCRGPPAFTKTQVVENGKVGGGLKINMPPPPPSTTAPPPVTPVLPATISTPLSTRTRYPRENPTLEYGAYDNPALAPSPDLENKVTTPTTTTTPVSRRQESSF